MGTPNIQLEEGEELYQVEVAEGFMAFVVVDEDNWILKATNRLQEFKNINFEYLHLCCEQRGWTLEKVERLTMPAPGRR